MEPITSWIHLSDIHYGYVNKNVLYDQTLILESLKEDILTLNKHDIPLPRYVMITGDIAYSGSTISHNEYSKFENWFKDILMILKIDKESVFLVPGNHDVQRNIANKNVRRLLDGLRDNNEKIDNALADPNDNELLELRLENYYNFSKSYGPQKTQKHFSVHRIKISNSIYLKIACLNTALLSSDDFDKSKLQLGNLQIQMAILNSMKRENEICIILTHHPMDWLRDGNYAEDWINKNADIHLYGHLHHQDNMNVKYGGGSDIVKIGAGTLYSEDNLDSRLFGYNVTALYKNDNKLVLRCWPRTWSQKNCEFRQDIHNLPSEVLLYSEHKIDFLFNNYPTIKKQCAEQMTNYENNLYTYIQNNLLLEIYSEKKLENLLINTNVISKDDKGNIKILDFSKLLEKEKVAVVGEPGSGKTTALRSLTLSLLKDKQRAYVPIYISLASFYMDIHKNNINTFSEYIDTELNIMGCANLDIFQRSCTGKIIFLLDGWDEIHDENAYMLIKQFLSENNFNFIITTRPIAQRHLPFTDVFEIHPLTKENIETFVRLRIKNQYIVHQLIDWLSNTPDMDRIAQNPLNLSIITIVFKEAKQLDKLTKSKLFERAFETIIRQHHREHPYDGLLLDNEDQTLQLEHMLQNIAYETIDNQGGRFFTDRQFQKAATLMFGKVPLGLKELLTGRLGIIRDRRAGKMEFFHLWYQEFLAARKIIDQNEKILDILNDRKFRNILPYVIGLLDDNDLAFNILLKVEIHDPFNYCKAIFENVFTEYQIEELLIRIISFGEYRSPKIPVRVELAKALSGAGNIIIKSLLKILKDEKLNDYTRRAALEALAILPVPENEFEEVIISLLDTKAIGLLWHIIEHIGVRKLSLAQTKLEEYRNHNNPIVVGDAAWAFNQISKANNIKLKNNEVEGIFGLLKSEDKHVQGHALRTLGRLKIKSALPKLKNHLLNNKSGYRWIVPESAVMINSLGVLDILSISLIDFDERVIASALKGLQEINSPISNEILQTVYSHTFNDTWIPSIESSLGNIAKNTYDILVKKPINLTPLRELATIFISRHCTSIYNLEHRIQGIMDIPLSNEGKIQAKKNAELLKNNRFDIIISSPLKRAAETANIYSAILNIPVNINSKLTEIDHGVWQGEKIEILMNDSDSYYQKWFRNPNAIEIPKGSESIVQIRNRILEAIKEIAITFANKNVLIITHKHISAVFRCILNQQDFSYFSSNIVESIEPEKVDKNDLALLLKDI